jgi:DNA-binding transcriptional ArsR family regulator
MASEEQQNPVTASFSEEPRDLRYRRQFFPDAEELVFDTATRGYVPLPILVRKLLRHLTPPEVRVLMYLYMRASKHRICYPPIEEIAEELSLNRKNVTTHLKALERKRLIAAHTAKGRRYFLMLDPRVALQQLVDTGVIIGEELFLLNDLCRELKRDVFVLGGGRTVAKLGEAKGVARLR